MATFHASPRRRLPHAQERRGTPLDPAAARRLPRIRAPGRLRPLQTLHGRHRPEQPHHPPLAAGVRECCQCGNVANSQCQFPIGNWQHWHWQHWHWQQFHTGNICRARRFHREALRRRRDVARLALAGGPRDDRPRAERARHDVELGRRRREPRALRHGEEQRDQAGGLGTLRRDHRVPPFGEGPADQARAGREAGRGRTAPRTQGQRVRRAPAPREAGHDAHLPAAAPRHLLDRGPRAAHLRPQMRESRGARVGEARLRGGRRHDRRRRREGPCRRSRDLRLRRRHRRGAAHLGQARRPPLGARPRRSPPDAHQEQPPRPREAAGGRTAPHGTRHRDRRDARRGRVRIRHVDARLARLRAVPQLQP